MKEASVPVTINVGLVAVEEGQSVFVIALTNEDAARLRELIHHDGAGMAPKRLTDNLKGRLVKALAAFASPTPPKPTESRPPLDRMSTRTMGKRAPR